MANEILKRLPDEDERQYIWRIGQAKDNGEIELTWEQLAPVMAEECDCESGESVWRKRYAEGLAWKPVFDGFGGTEEQIMQLKDEQRQLKMERIKMRDERNEFSKRLREEARFQDKLDMLETSIKRAANMPKIKCRMGDHCGTNDLFASLADLHIGETFKSYGGEYNTDIAAQRLQHYAEEIITIGIRHRSENLYVGLLGDAISGSIHKTIQISNRENVIEQVMVCSELCTRFIETVSPYFKNVYVSGVTGNHSRIDKKEDSVVDERLDSLILWYMQAKLTHFNNVYVELPSKDNMGTLCAFTIRDKEYVLSHGDFDDMSDNSISKLAMYLGHLPYCIVMGHKHTPAYNEHCGIQAVRCGSLAGSGGQFTVEKRLRGNPSQTVLVCGKKGIECVYNINLDIDYMA